MSKIMRFILHLWAENISSYSLLIRRGGNELIYRLINGKKGGEIAAAFVVDADKDFW